MVDAAARAVYADTPSQMAAPTMQMPTGIMQTIATCAGGINRHQKRRVARTLSPRASGAACRRGQLLSGILRGFNLKSAAYGCGMATTPDYYVTTVDAGARPHPWRWEIRRHSKPMGVNLGDGGYQSQAAAEYAGNQAL